MTGKWTRKPCLPTPRMSLQRLSFLSASGRDYHAFARLMRPSNAARARGFAVEVAIRPTNAILSLAGAVSGYCPLTNHEACDGRSFQESRRILQQHPGA